MNIPIIDPAQAGANIVKLRKAAGLSVHDLQMVFGFNSPQIFKHTSPQILPNITCKSW